MGLALSAADTMIGLAVTGDGAVEADEVLATMLAIGRIAHSVWEHILILTSIIMYEDARNVNAVGTGHTILAIVAGDVFEAHNLLRHILLQVFHLFFSQRHQRAVAEQVVLQVLHIGHTAENGQDAFGSACIAEGPGGNAPLGVVLLQLRHQVLGQLDQTATQQRFHDDGRNTAFLQLCIQVAGVGVVLVDFVGIVPVEVVQLYLHEIPLVFIVVLQEPVEDSNVSVI